MLVNYSFISGVDSCKSNDYSHNTDLQEWPWFDIWCKPGSVDFTELSALKKPN